MKLERVAGFAVDQDVDLVVNSANGLLMLGSSGAGRIRDLSADLTLAEDAEYDSLLKRLGRDIRNFYLDNYSSHGWKRHHAQMGCLRLLLKHGPYRPGTAVLQSGWSKKDSRPLVHAVAMSYDPRTEKRIHGTVPFIRSSVRAALRIAERLGVKSLALPVMVARPEYGITPEESYKTIVSVLKQHGQFLKKAIICFDNKTTKKFLKTL